MDILDVLAARRELELRIHADLQSFADKTGLTPTAVDVKTFSVAPVLAANGERRVELSGVRVQVQL